MAEDFVGARVRFWRLKRGVSQRTLAGLAGITQGYVSQIEAGLKEIDKRSTLVRLADALQVSVADLTGHIEYGSALASTHRADNAALAQFVNAERIAPQRVRLSPIVRDTVGAMLRRVRADAGGEHLRDLASRIGVA